MKLKYLPFIVLIAFLASCSTAYKTGQTPDDLYYSKGKTVETDTYVQNTYSTEDHRIRMAAYDWRWRTLDDRYDYNCNYSPYNYGYNYGYYYNPYYYPYPVYSPGIKYINPKNTVIRTTNLNTYSHTTAVYTPSKTTGTTHTITVRGYNTSNSNNTRSNDNSTRTYTPATNNSSSNNTSTNSNSNSNTSSGTPVTRPARGN